MLLFCFCVHFVLFVNCFIYLCFIFSVVESAAGVVASAKTGAEMIEDSSK